LVDSGSGYNSQNDAPVHFGLAKIEPVDIEVTVPKSGKRVITIMKKVNPLDWQGRSVVVK
jgi:hypothetical protein